MSQECVDTSVWSRSWAECFRLLTALVGSAATPESCRRRSTEFRLYALLGFFCGSGITSVLVVEPCNGGRPKEVARDSVRSRRRTSRCTQAAGDSRTHQL